MAVGEKSRKLPPLRETVDILRAPLVLETVCVCMCPPLGPRLACRFEMSELSLLVTAALALALALASCSAKLEATDGGPASKWSSSEAESEQSGESGVSSGSTSLFEVCAWLCESPSETLLCVSLAGKTDADADGVLRSVGASVFRLLGLVLDLAWLVLGDIGETATLLSLPTIVGLRIVLRLSTVGLRIVLRLSTVGLSTVLRLSTVGLRIVLRLSTVGLSTVRRLDLLLDSNTPLFFTAVGVGLGFGD